jgi:hypothetical protein
MPIKSVVDVVKDKKSKRSMFKKELKVTKDPEGKSRMKEEIESIAFGELVSSLDID